MSKKTKNSWIAGLVMFVIALAVGFGLSHVWAPTATAVPTHGVVLVRIDLGKKTTYPDPVHVRTGQRVMWICTRYFEVEIQEQPGHQNPHDPMKFKSKKDGTLYTAMSGPAKKVAEGHWYKMVITVKDLKDPIDPHIWYHSALGG